MTSCSRAASSTVRVHGPAWSSERRQRHEAVARDAAVGRLGADRAGDGRGLADRATGVGADRERRLERRDDRRRAAAGAAGDPLEVPRVVARAVGAVLGGGAHRELVHVGLAEDRHPGLAQPGHEGRVVRRHPALQDLRAAGRRQALGRHDVLDGDRHAGQRVQRLAGGAAPVDARRPGRGRPRRRRGGRSARRRRRRRCGRGGPGPPRAPTRSPGRGGRRARRRWTGSGRWSRRGFLWVRGRGEVGGCRVAGIRSALRGVGSVLVEDARHGEALLLALGGAGQRGLRARARGARRRGGSR